ncbi:hypothetical protein IAU60_000724 [Kwoniella sp. DSM 27419]
MRSFFLAALTLAGLISASPLVAEKRDSVKCGTTKDATFSDCQALTQDPNLWNSVWAGGSNKCGVINWSIGPTPFSAWNVACHENCCVYMTDMNGQTNDPTQYDTQDAIRNNAASLLGCADTAADKVNAVGIFYHTYLLCLSNGDGCGDVYKLIEDN